MLKVIWQILQMPKAMQKLQKENQDKYETIYK